MTDTWREVIVPTFTRSVRYGKVLTSKRWINTLRIQTDHADYINDIWLGTNDFRDVSLGPFHNSNGVVFGIWDPLCNSDYSCDCDMSIYDH